MERKSRVRRAVRVQAEVQRAKPASLHASALGGGRRVSVSPGRAAAGARAHTARCSSGPVSQGERLAVHVVTEAARNRSSLLALLPFMCAVHCVVTPVLVAFVPVLGVSSWAEWCLLAISVAAAMFALGRGTRSHRNGIVRVLAGNGVAIWALSLLGVFEPMPETLTSPVGGLVLAAALFWNGRLSHRHECGECGCPMH